MPNVGVFKGLLSWQSYILMQIWLTAKICLSKAICGISQRDVTLIWSMFHQWYKQLCILQLIPWLLYLPFIFLDLSWIQLQISDGAEMYVIITVFFLLLWVLWAIFQTIHNYFLLFGYSPLFKVTNSGTKSCSIFLDSSSLDILGTWHISMRLKI